MSNTAPTPDSFTLTPPEPVQAISPERAPSLAPLNAEKIAKVDDQVSRFLDALMREDLGSDGFRSRLDSASNLGRQEISVAASLMAGRFLERNFVDMTDTPAFKAIASMRAQLDELNPGKQGDLLSQNRLLGVIPYGNKLKAYFRRFQSASTQLNTIMQQVYAARDDMQKDAVEIENVKVKLWDGMQKLNAAIHFARELDSRLADKVESLKAADPLRARALEQEVLFYARQNLTDMQTQMAVCVNGYLAMEVLKKTAREMANGCSRIATTGMSALAVAQTVARATGNQVEVMNMLGGVNDTVGSLIEQTGKQLGEHVQRTGEFASNPLIGVERLQSMFDQSFAAMDAMDNFRSQAISVMGKNNEFLQEQIARAKHYVERAHTGVSAAAGNLSGPVSL